MKIDTRNYRKVHVGTDFHWRHDRDFVWGNRGFPDVLHHDLALELEVREAFYPDDLFIYLGDWALNCSQEQAENFLQRIPCPIIYVLGNHDQRLRRLMHREKTGKTDDFGVRVKNQLFDITFYEGVLEAVFVKGDGVKQAVSFSHYPLREWNHMNKGSWSLSGHVHGSLDSGLPTNLDNKCLDLSYDSVGKFLLTFEEVDAIMQKKETKVFHHGKP